MRGRVNWRDERVRGREQVKCRNGVGAMLGTAMGLGLGDCPEEEVDCCPYHGDEVWREAFGEKVV